MDSFYFDILTSFCINCNPLHFHLHLTEFTSNPLHFYHPFSLNSTCSTRLYPTTVYSTLLHYTPLYSIPLKLYSTQTLFHSNSIPLKLYSTQTLFHSNSTPRHSSTLFHSTLFSPLHSSLLCYALPCFPLISSPFLPTPLHSTLLIIKRSIYNMMPLLV